MAARQALLSVGFPRQEYWSGLPFPSPRDLPDPEIELESPALKAEPPGKPQTEEEGERKERERREDG